MNLVLHRQRQSFSDYCGRNRSYAVGYNKAQGGLKCNEENRLWSNRDLFLDAFLFPIYILIMNSFKTTKGIFTDVLGFPAKGTFTLENYKNAFQELDYIRSFMNSLLITVVTAVLVLLISAMAARVLVRYKTKASKIIF